jgi:hypothetical protein
MQVASLAFDPGQQYRRSITSHDGCIWMGGQSLAADSDGYLYAITGNGDFDPSQGWYGESFVKVKYMLGPPAKPEVVDQWSPWTDYGRAGKPLPAERMAGMSMASEAGRRQHEHVDGKRARRRLHERAGPACCTGLPDGYWAMGR